MGDRWSGPRGRVQVGGDIRKADRSARSLMLPEPVLRLAQDEYDIQFPGQPYGRMQERGGLGLLEVVSLLADALERRGPSASSPSMFSDVEVAESSDLGPEVSSS